MGYVKSFVVCLFVSAALAFSGIPAMAGTDVLTETERQWLTGRAKIRIGVMDAWPPMNFLDDNGIPSGIGADYVREMNRLLDGRLEMVPGPFKTGMEMVKQGALDALMDITPKPERKKVFHFTRVYLDIPHVIVGPRDGAFYRSEEDLAGKTLALEEGFYNNTYFQNKYPDVKIRNYPDTARALDAVARGEADAYAGNRAIAAYIMEKELMAALRFHGRLQKPGSVLAIGVRKDLPELAAILDKALAAVSSSQKRRIMARYVSVTDRAERPTASQPPVMSYKNLVGLGVVLIVLIAAVFFILIKVIRQERVAVSFGSSWFRAMVVAGLSVFILVVAGLGLLLTERTRQAVLKDAESHLGLVLSLIQDRTDMWLEERTALMRRLGKDPQLVAVTRRLLEVPPDRQSLLASGALADARAFFRASPDIFRHIGFFIINPDRISIGSMRDANLGTRNLIADQYPELVERAFQGEAGFIPPMTSDVPLAGGGSRDGHPPTIFFISPVQDVDGKILAVMTLRIDPVRDLAKLTRSPGRWETDDVYAFDRGGRMISPSRFEGQLREIGLMGPDQSSSLTMEIRDPGGDLTQGFRPEKDAGEWPLTRMAEQALVLRHHMSDQGILNGVSGMGIDMDGYRDYRGVRVFGAWLWNRDLDMGLAAEIDVAEVMAGFKRIRMTVFAILGGTLALSVFSVLLVLVLGERTRKTLEKARNDLEETVAERTMALQENQERFAALLESAPDAMVVSDESGTIVLVNSRTEQLLEYDRSELLGESVDMLVPLDKRKDHPENRHRYLSDAGIRQKGAEGLELTAQSKCGSLISVEISLSPIESRSGTLVVASIRDITERKQAEEALRASEENFRQILESVGDGIFGVDTDGCVSFMNPSALRLLGYDADELIGRPIHDQIHHTHKDGNPFPVENCPMYLAYTRGDHAQVSNEMLWRKDGSGFDVEYSAVPMMKGRKISGAVITFRDITRRKEIESALASERKQLQNILDTSPVGVAIFTKHRVHFANPRFVDMFGVREGETVPELYVKPEERERVWKTLCGGSRIENREVKMYGKNRRIRDMLVTYMPMDIEGERGSLGWVLDITDRKRAEREIRDRFEELNRFRQLAVGRENRMIQLKEEINELARRLGEDARYKIVTAGDTMLSNTEESDGNA